MIADPPSPRVQELADQYQRALTALLAVADNCTAAEWQTRCANEARTVGVLVHHLGSTVPTVLDAIGQVAGGTTALALTQEMVDHINARHAAEFARARQAETLEFLRERSATVLAFIRALDEAQLDRTARVPVFGEEPVSVYQLIEFLLIGHILGHLASIETALGL